MNPMAATLMTALEHNTVLSSFEKEEIRKILNGDLPPYEEVLKKQTDTSTAEKFQQELKSIAMEFIGSEDAYGIYIGGQTGCGKTHICTAIAGQYIKQGKSVRYMTWRDDSVVLKSYANSPEYHDIISDFK